MKDIKQSFNFGCGYLLLIIAVFSILFVLSSALS